MPSKKFANYVKKQNKNLPEYKFGLISVIIKDPIQNDINFEYVFNKVNNLISSHFLKLIDIVYIGDFKFFEKRQINALYADGSLYISNDQDDNEDMLDDIIHEIAHAVEEKYGQFIYSDGEIENEFLFKRKMRRYYRKK